jgi:MFS family permease
MVASMPGQPVNESRSMIPVGSMIFAGSTLLFALDHRSLWEAFVAAGLSGIAVGFTFAAMPGFMVRAVAPAQTGSATGFYQTLRSVGLSVGSALAAAVLTGYTRAGAAYPTEAKPTCISRPWSPKAKGTDLPLPSRVWPTWPKRSWPAPNSRGWGR